MKRFVSKVLALGTAIMMTGILWCAPNTTEAASNFQKSKIYYTNNRITDIELSWVDGNSELLFVLHCENPYDEWDKQAWTIGQFYAKGGNESIDLRQKSAERDKMYLAITNALKGYGQEDCTGCSDFKTQVDMDGDSYDTDLKFEVVPPPPAGMSILTNPNMPAARTKLDEGRIGYFKRTDGNTNAKVEQDLTISKTKLEGSGAGQYAFADGGETHIYFGTADGNLRIKGADPFASKSLTVNVNKLGLLQERSATGETLPVACKDTAGTIVCAKSEDDCTKNMKGQVVKNCSGQNPPQVCRPQTGCVDASNISTQPSATPAIPGPTIKQDVKPVVTKTIDILNPLRFNNPQDLAVGIINFILGLAGLVALGIMIVGGYQYITSRGEEAETAKAKLTLTYAVIGLLIIILSFIIVRTVTNVIGGGGTTSGTPTPSVSPTVTTSPSAPKTLPVPGQPGSSSTTP